MQLKESLKVFEAFSGIGTQHMALKRIGIEFDIVAISEIDTDAIKSYIAIHGEVNNLGDISQINLKDVPDHDLFTYSFPCQDISKDGILKGLSKDSGTRSSLLWDAIKIIEHKKPKYLLAENVKNLISKRFIDDFNEYISYLDKIGYNTYYQVINSIGYIPQNRERVFIVSIRKDVDDSTFVFPKKQDTTMKLIDYLEDNPHERYFIDQEMTDKLIFKGGDKVKEGLKIVNATALGYIIGVHGDGIDMGYPTSTTRRGRVQKEKIQTLTTKDNLGVILKNEYGYYMRKLSPFEYWRLMDISDSDYKKVEAITSRHLLYKQAGNSIVVAVLEDIFRNLFTKAINNDII